MGFSFYLPFIYPFSVSFNYGLMLSYFFAINTSFWYYLNTILRLLHKHIWFWDFSKGLWNEDCIWVSFCCDSGIVELKFGNLEFERLFFKLKFSQDSGIFKSLIFFWNYNKINQKISKRKQISLQQRQTKFCRADDLFVHSNMNMKFKFMNASHSAIIVFYFHNAVWVIIKSGVVEILKGVLGCVDFRSFWN